MGTSTRSAIPRLRRLAHDLRRVCERPDAALAADGRSLAAALETLSSAEREVIERCDLGAESSARVARQLGYSLRHVYRLRRRGLAALCARLDTDTVVNGRQAEGGAALDDECVRQVRTLFTALEDPERCCEHPLTARIVERARAAGEEPLAPFVRRSVLLATDTLADRLRSVLHAQLRGEDPVETAAALGLSVRQLFRVRRNAARALYDALQRGSANESHAAGSDPVVCALAGAMRAHERGQSPQALVVLRELVRASSEARPGTFVAFALLHVASAAGARSDALAALHDLFRTESDADPRARAVATIADAVVDSHSADAMPLRAAADVLEREHDEGAPYDRLSALAWVHLLVADAEANQGRYSECEAAARRALAVARGAGLGDIMPWLVVRAMRNAGSAAVFRPGRFADGVRLLRHAYDACVAHDLARERAVLTFDLGGACVIAGRFRRAADYAGQLLRAPIPLPPAQAFAVGLDYAVSLARAGDVRAARTAIARLEVLPEYPLADAVLALASAELECGNRSAESVRHATRASVLAAGKSKRLEAAAACVLAEGLLALGRRAAARDACHASLALHAERSNSAMFARTLELAATLTGSAAYRRDAVAIREELGAAFSMS